MEDSKEGNRGGSSMTEKSAFNFMMGGACLVQAMAYYELYGSEEIYQALLEAQQKIAKVLDKQ